MLGKRRYFLIHRDANGLDFAFTMFFVGFRANRIMTKDSKTNISDHGFKMKVGRRPRIQNEVVRIRGKNKTNQIGTHKSKLLGINNGNTLE
jgi:hypothetical protein